MEDNFFNYLRNVESRIPKSDYGADKFKPFFGALFEIDDLVYVTQVSSTKNKPRLLTMKEDLDFIKLYDDERLIAVVNLNYMFPVPKTSLIEVEYKNIEHFRTFRNETEKNKYIGFLKKEMKQIMAKKVSNKAIALYKRKYDYPGDRVSLRCFDFKLLEQKCVEYTQQLMNLSKKEIAAAQDD